MKLTGVVSTNQEWYLLLGRVQLFPGGADGALPLLPQSLHVCLQLPQLSYIQTRGMGGVSR